MAGLKPVIMTVEVGIRELKEIKIYPLSMADQLSLPDKLIDAICKVSNIDYSGLAQSTMTKLADKLSPATPTPEQLVDEALGQTAAEKPDDKDMAVVKVILDLIKENIEYILEKSTDGLSLAEVTNEQFIEIVDVIFTVNYEQTVGKVMDLARRVKKLFRPEPKVEPGPPPPSQESTAL